MLINNILDVKFKDHLTLLYIKRVFLLIQFIQINIIEYKFLFQNWHIFPSWYSLRCSEQPLEERKSDMFDCGIVNL